MMSGCYVITHRLTGGFYIGSTRHLEGRWADHRSRIKAGTHCNRNIRALGTNPADFCFDILIICAPEDRQMYEARLLDRWAGRPGFMNELLGANAPTESTRAKIVAATVGAKNHFYGKRHSPESIAKQRAAKLGKKHSLEAKAKMSASRSGGRSWRCGKPLDPQTRAKISAALMGRKASPETRAKMCAVRKGRLFRKAIT